MSPWNAPAVCCSTVAALAFQPKRPSAGPAARASHTMLARPEMPSPSASSGSAASRIDSAGMASSRPMPITCGASRGLVSTSSASGPKAGSAIS